MSTNIKLKRSSVQGKVPTTSDLDLGEIAINTHDGKIFIKSDDGVENIKQFEPGTKYTDSDTSSFLNGNVNTDIIPDTNEVYDLGTPSKRFRELYLSGNTINIGGAEISSDGTGKISISANGAVLPIGSRIELDATIQRNIATITEGGSVEVSIPFFTKANGINTPARSFLFKSNPNKKVFKQFTLSNGETIQDAETTLFFF
jgi:hypothetical protein